MKERPLDIAGSSRADALARLERLARGQDGVATRTQARTVGLTDDRLRRLVAAGILAQIGTNAFRLLGAPSTPLGDVRGLVLDVGGDAVACRATAAALHGLDGFRLAPPYDVAVGRGRHVNRIGHRIHTVTRLPDADRATVSGIAVTGVERTLVDVARNARPDEVTAAIDGALRDRLTTEDSLHRRVAVLRGPGRAGIGAVIRALEGLEITKGGHSWLEREFLRLVAEAGLPRPVTQAALARAGDHLVRVDAVFPGTRVVVEVLGYRYHRTAAHMARDAQRTNALLAQGYEPYQFTYRQVVDTPHDVVATVRAALDRAA
ncbi:MAG: DUF559 domain-containing protein [Actinomycetota bacterium]